MQYSDLIAGSQPPRRSARVLRGVARTALRQGAERASPGQLSERGGSLAGGLTAGSVPSKALLEVGRLDAAAGIATKVVVPVSDASSMTSTVGNLVGEGTRRSCATPTKDVSRGSASGSGAATTCRSRGPRAARPAAARASLAMRTSEPSAVATPPGAKAIPVSRAQSRGPLQALQLKPLATDPRYWATYAR